MGTYTTNYNLFMPTVGEQGWGTLVNGNFSTIDTTMKGLSNRTTTLENTATAFDVRLQPFEEHISFESDGTLITDSAKVKKLYVVPELSTQYGDIVYATNTQPSLSVDQQNTASAGTKTTNTITVNGYAINSNITFPLKVGTGMYIESNSDLVVPKLTGLTATFNFRSYVGGWGKVYKNGTAVCSVDAVYGTTVTKTITVNEGDKIYIQHSAGSSYGDYYMVFNFTITPAPNLRIW